MNTVMKLLCSLSVSGSLLIVFLLACSRLLKDKVSRQWQYYIWIIAICRLLLPFGPEINLMGKVYQEIDQEITRAAAFLQSPDRNGLLDAIHLEADSEISVSTVQGDDFTVEHPIQDVISQLTEYIWLIWLVAALCMLIRKITVYQSFMRYIKAGLMPVCDMKILDALAVSAEKMNIKRPVELGVNPLVSSPLLIGFFRPCIVLPDAGIPEKDLQYILLHELTHHKRLDLLYKWLVQITVCLHWFNPFVYLMAREIARACEFSCDEAVLAKTGNQYAQDYGKTLLDAMAAVGRYKETFGAVTLSENKQLLKERLEAIMNFRKKPKAIRALTGVLTAGVVLGAFFLGVYPATAAEASETGRSDRAAESDGDDTLMEQAETYYKAGSLPLFQLVFSRLDEENQGIWMERIYADGETAFFSVASDYSGEEELERWLDRALQDEKTAFQSILFQKLKRYEEWEAMEEELEARQLAKCEDYGITRKGKEYYYEGRLVNVFLDIRANSSFYTLDINPQGEVSIRISRDEKGEIESVESMSDTEVEELLGDMEDPDDGDD